MKSFFSFAGALVTSVLLTGPLTAQTTVYSVGDTTSGTYMDYMKTVYARAGNPEVVQLPLTSFRQGLSVECHGGGILDAVCRRADLDVQAARRPCPV